MVMSSTMSVRLFLPEFQRIDLLELVLGTKSWDYISEMTDQAIYELFLDIDQIAKKFKEKSDIILEQGDIGLEFQQNSDPHNSQKL